MIFFCYNRYHQPGQYRKVFARGTIFLEPVYTERRGRPKSIAIVLRSRAGVSYYVIDVCLYNDNANEYQARMLVDPPIYSDGTPYSYGIW